MSIADEPGLSQAAFWHRVTEADTGPDPLACNVVLVPGAPLILTLSDGRQFVGTSLRDLLGQVERGPSPA